MTRPKPGSRPPAPDQITYTATWSRPARWWVAGTDGKPPRASTAYERAQVASRILQDAIQTARTAPRTAHGHGSTTDADTAHAFSHQHDRPDTDTTGVEHDQAPAVAPTPAQRAAAVAAHQQAAMPKQLLPPAPQADPDPQEPAPEPESGPEVAPEPEHEAGEEAGRTTDPGTWMRSPENLERLAAFTREAAARSRGILEREQKPNAVDPASQQQHTQQAAPRQGTGQAPR
ncbi:hypothetical protein ABT010_38310 [Streptomyces sp. NPDC002668]|uniref:hypothetical protein n=1 Tax=Streptomyces sp. NPDC002668 TaxID=3154422 RepID=UPI0033258CBD